MMQESMYIFSIVVAIVCFIALCYYFTKEKDFTDFIIQLVLSLTLTISIMFFVDIQSRKNVKEKLIEIGKIQYSVDSKTGETYTVLKDSSLKQIYEMLNK